MLFEEAKSWSLIDHRPVLFGEGCCFWLGYFMSERMALTIGSCLLYKSPCSPSMKQSLHDDMFEKCCIYEKDLSFKIDNYGPEYLWSYLTYGISDKLNESEIFKSWNLDKLSFLRLFLEK